MEANYFTILYWFWHVLILLKHRGFAGVHLFLFCSWSFNYTDGYQFSSIAQSCLTLCDPVNCSTPGLPVHPNSQSSLKLTSIKSVMPSSHLILYRPLFLLPPIPPSIRVFSNESVLCIRWPKYWSFSFSISPSSEYLGLISFRMNWLDLPDVRCPRLPCVLVWGLS